MIKLRRKSFACLIIIAGMGLALATQAAGVSGAQAPQVNTVSDWRPVPAQDELDKLVANPVNDPKAPYTDYRPGAPEANLDLPGAAILATMNRSADIFGSRPTGQPKHTDQGYKLSTGCLKTKFAPTNWSDIAIHYYCQMSLPRACYTFALSGKSTGGVKYPRPKPIKAVRRERYPRRLILPL